MAKKATELSPADIQNIIDSRPIKNALGVLADKYGIGTSRIRSIWTTAYGGPDLKSYANYMKDRSMAKAVVETEAKEEPKAKASANKEHRVSSVGGKTLRAVPPKVTSARSKPAKVVNRERIEDIELDVGQLEAGNQSGDLIDRVTKASGRAVGLAKTATMAALRQAELANQLAIRSADNTYADEDSASDIEIDDVSSCSVDGRYGPTPKKSVAVPRNVKQDNRHPNINHQTYEAPPIHQFASDTGYTGSSEIWGSSSEEEGDTRSPRPSSLKTDSRRRPPRARPTYRSAADHPNTEESADHKTTARRGQSVRTPRHQPKDQEEVYEGYQTGREGYIGGRRPGASISGQFGGRTRTYAETPSVWSRDSFVRPL